MKSIYHVFYYILVNLSWLVHLLKQTVHQKDLAQKVEIAIYQVFISLFFSLFVFNVIKLQLIQCNRVSIVINRNPYQMKEQEIDKLQI